MQADDTIAPEDGRADLENAKQTNLALSALGIAAAAGFWLGGATLHLPSASVLALLPIALIYFLRRAPMSYAIGKPKGDPRADLSIGFMACGFGLIFGNGDLHFVEIQTLLGFAGLVGLLGCALVFEPARKNPRFWGAMFSTFFFAGAYGWGLATAADSLSDKSAPASYTTIVTDKYALHHRGTTYHLTLAPWGPMVDSNDLTVSEDTYDSAGIGRHLCLELHPGVLHVQWYRPVACITP
jgi:hypothetical protein